MDYLYFFPILLFSISILGIIMNQGNIILILICIEMMLLSISVHLLLYSFTMDVITGQIYSIYIITTAAVESAIGLSMMISFYNINGSIAISHLNLLSG